MNGLVTKQLTLDLTSLAETTRLGERLGELLFPGAVVALVGPLGAGKTTLTRAIAVGLGVLAPEQVTSPTFVLIQEYAARLPIYHFDAYRLKKASDLEDLGALEYFAGEGVCLVEWADRVTTLLPTEHLRIDISLIDQTIRHVCLQANGLRYVQLMQQIEASSLS